MPRWTRWFVWVFLGAFVLSGAAGVEAWPFTGWRLFSHLRTAHDVSWQATVAGPGGTERPFPFSRLPVGYRNFTLVAKRFQDMDANARANACDAWIAAARRLGDRVVEVRIYRVDRDLSERRGDRSEETRTLAYRCGRPG